MSYLHPSFPKGVADARSLVEAKRPKVVARRRNCLGSSQFHARSMVHQDVMEETAWNHAITVLLYSLVVSDSRSCLAFVLH